MAKEIKVDYGVTGSTLYALVLNSSGQVWNGSAFETIVAGNWATYDIAMTEESITGIYTGTFPSLPAGRYGISIRKQSTATPATTDTMLGSGHMDWSGTAELFMLTEAQVNAQADLALSDVGLTTTVTGRIDAAISSRSTLAAGAQMDLVNAPNDTALVAINTKLSGVHGAGSWVDTGVTTPAAIDAVLTASHGAGSWSGLGTGAVAKLIHIEDPLGFGVDNVDVWVTTDIAGANIIARGYTDAFGNITFMLDPGSYYCWKDASGYNETNPEVLVVP